MKRIIQIVVLLVILLYCNKDIAYAKNYEQGVAGISLSIEKCNKEYDIEDDTLSNDIQEYLIDKCSEQEVNPEFVLALIKKESSYDVNAIHHNNNGSYDRGLAQINSYYESYYEDLYGEKFDPYDAYDSIDFILYRINDEKEYWIDYGIKGVKISYCILGSYNMGRSGYRHKMVKNNKYIYSYIEDILEIIDTY